MAEWWQSAAGVAGGLPVAAIGTEYDPFGLLHGKPMPKLPQYDNPGRPGYIQSWDPNTMSIQPYAAQLTSQIRPDTRGLQQYRQEALRAGPSAWSGLARAQMSADEARSRGTLQNQAAADAATARSQMAMRGGISGGARERLAAGANRNAMMGAQGLAGQGLVNRAQLSATDEANRIKMLQGLPGMEIEALKPAQWSAETNLRARTNDINSAISENQARNLFNMQNYQEQMRALQANRNADVQMATAKKDRGLIGNIFGGLFG